MAATFSEIIDFDYRCNASMLSELDGTAREYLYVQSDDVHAPNFNCVFAIAPLTDSLISDTKKRLEKAGRTLSFVVIPGSENEKKCREIGLSLVVQLGVYSRNITDIEFQNEKISDHYQLTITSFPYARGFLELMDEAFFSRGSDRDEWNDVFKKMPKNENLDERVFTLLDGEKTVSIAQTNCDYASQKAFLYNVATAENYQRQGFSKFVLSAAMSDAQSLGINDMYLTTANPHAADLYTTMKFSLVGNKAIYTQK